MKKRLLALFLTLGLVCTVLTACGDGSKGQGGQGNNPNVSSGFPWLSRWILIPEGSSIVTCIINFIS